MIQKRATLETTRILGHIPYCSLITISGTLIFIIMNLIETTRFDSIDMNKKCKIELMTISNGDSFAEMCPLFAHTI